MQPMTAEEYYGQQEQDWYSFVEAIGGALREIGAAINAACVYEATYLGCGPDDLPDSYSPDFFGAGYQFGSDRP